MWPLGPAPRVSGPHHRRPHPPLEAAQACTLNSYSQHTLTRSASPTPTTTRLQVPEGKGENSFAFDGRWLGAADALSVIEATHRQWQRALDTRPKPQLAAVFGEAAVLAAAAKGPWLPPLGAPVHHAGGRHNPRAPRAPASSASGAPPPPPAAAARPAAVASSAAVRSRAVGSER